MKLVQKYMEQGIELNITGNAGTHYNGVKIVEVYDDFIAIEPTESALQTAGQFRGGRTNINIYTITRLEEAGTSAQVRDSLRRGVIR
jgi:hypothetical protein